MANKLILLTGVTGYVGFATLLEALKSGHKIRAAVRSDEKAKKLQDNPALKKAHTTDGQLSFVTVPDFKAPNAFDAAMEGVGYVLHIASPVPDPTVELSPEELQTQFVNAAVNCTVSVLASAKKAGSVERVVVTSSAAALVPMSAFQDYDGTVYNADTHPAEIPGPYPNSTVAYFASKVAARNAVEQWMKDNKPGFDWVQIHPSMVTGRVEVASTPEAVVGTSNFYALGPVLGLPPPPAPLPGAVVHIEDVAKLHLRALNGKIAGNKSYAATAEGPDGVSWDSAKDIAKQYFPEAVEKGLLPCSTSAPSMVVKLDASETEKAFGITFQPFEEQVKSVVGQYVELAEQKA